MVSWWRWVAVFLLAAAAGRVSWGDEPAPKWPTLNSTTKPWAYWWWLGSAVDRDNLRRELTRYRDAGMGGVHIIPIYGAKGAEPRYIEYLSPQWLEMLDYTVRTAGELGLGIDMTTGSGWCFGGPGVAPVESCMRPEVAQIEVAPGKPIKLKLTAGQPQALIARGPKGETVDLAGKLNADGTLNWQAPGQDWRVWAVASLSTKMMVKRAAPGGVGFMLNPFYTPAVTSYLQWFDSKLAGYQGARPRAMYHDSYEYNSTWSPDLFEQFQKRRGYRLQDYLPELFAKEPADRELAARVKGDLRETISDVLIEEFTPPWTAWCRRNKVQTRYQAHGSPANLLDLYAQADMPETEMFNKDREPLVSKFASSAAHTQGRQRVCSETGTWLAEHFTETLGDVKKLVDDLFVSGVNHVVYHGTCYSPDDVAWPGWCFYASTEMNPRNAIWRDASALNAYIARCQSWLQAGRSDNDLLVYWPIHDLWHQADGLMMPLTVHKRGWLDDQPIGALARRLWNRGYSFDYLSDRQLATAYVEKGLVCMPGGRYRALLIPRCVHMPVPTMEKLAELAKAGGWVVFDEAVPSDVPGLRQREDRLQKLGIAAHEAHKYAESFVVTSDVESSLARAGVIRETLCDNDDMIFIRRAVGDSRLYFTAYRGDKSAVRAATIAGQWKTVWLLDPATGTIGRARSSVKPAATEVLLPLEPGKSYLLLASNKTQSAGADWQYVKAQGDPLVVPGPWQVQFVAGGPQLPAAYQTDSLTSWADRSDPAAQSFAGTARYSTVIQVAKAGQYRIDLGRVCHSARLRVNGHELPVLFAAPHVSAVIELKSGQQKLEVEVTGTSANRIRDLDRRGVVWRNFHDINLVNMDYKKFDASNWPLAPSGLLGPVRLLPVEVDTPSRPAASH